MKLSVKDFTESALGMVFMISQMLVGSGGLGSSRPLLEGFATISVAISEHSAIRRTGFRTTAICESNKQMTYLLPWEPLAKRDAIWAAFVVDPERESKRAYTQGNGRHFTYVRRQLLQASRLSVAK